MTTPMKKISSVLIITIACITFIQTKTGAQVINWENVSKQTRHLLHVNTGAEYGITAGLGYHHRLPIKSIPLWIGGECSVPSGNQLTDDFKVRLGTQIRIVAFGHLHLSARVQGISRRYHNQSVRLFNFGSDLSGTIGYYRKKWFLGAESGFDKAIVTNFKHSEWFRENIYDYVQDGWYEPATGGNFYYGLQAGYSLKKIDITVKAGKILLQDFKSRPLLPFYGQVGVNVSFGK